MKIVISEAKRTAIGAYMGTLQDVSAVDLGVIMTTAVADGLPPAEIADVLVGNVLQAGQGMNVARQIALRSGFPHTVPGLTLNRVCGSGLQSVISAVQAIKAGDGSLYLAGGTESMSSAPYLLKKARAGYRFGNGELIDVVSNDGLLDPTHGYAMGMTAENVAAAHGISREDQDAFSLESQRRAAAALDAGAFADEIVPVQVASRKASIMFSTDEHVRRDTTLEGLAKLRPAFKPQGGTVTAGNSSGLNDGAAMVSVMTEDFAVAHGLPIAAEIVAYAVVGIDPAIMGEAPVTAVNVALQRAGLQASDIGLFELNEAFAAQSIAVIRQLKLDGSNVNIHGGAIALGHPIGASGTRVLVTLVHALRTKKLEYGVASLCIGGGMGIAIVIRAR